MWSWLRALGQWLVLWPLWRRMPWRQETKLAAAGITGIVLLVIVIAVGAAAGGGEETPQAPAPSRAVQEPSPAPSPTPSPTVAAPPTPSPTPTPAPAYVRPAACIPDRPPQVATLVRVVDGDTIEVDLDGQVRPVRYIGVNTPERDQPYYAEATEANRRLLGDGRLFLYKDVSETDRYGRLLRYVVAGDRFVNLSLVREGYAQAATYPPDVACSETFVAAEREARAAQVGLWAPSSGGGQTTGGGAPPASGGGQPGGAAPPSGSVYYRNCAEAWAAGAAPLRRGQPGYRPELDADGDGVACETRPRR